MIILNAKKDKKVYINQHIFDYKIINLRVTNKNVIFAVSLLPLSKGSLFLHVNETENVIIQ